MMAQAGDGFKAKLQKAAARNGFDALVVMSPENFGYVSDIHIPTLQLIRPRQAVAIVPARGEPHLIVVTIEKSVAEAESWIRDATFYTEMVDDPVAITAGVLRKMGLAAGRIAVDGDYLPMNDFRALAAALPEATLVDGNPVITALRGIKDEKEIGKLEAATRATHRAAIDAMAAARSGDTERQLCAGLLSHLMIQGADVPLFLVLASGDNGLHIHPSPSDKAVAPDEIVRFDFGGRFGGVPSDLARTYSGGAPTVEQRQVYAALARVQAATVAAVRPDITAAALFDHCRTLFKAEGIDYRLPHIGHNMGHEFHEPPLLRPADKTMLRKGMTLNIEPIAFDSSGIVYHLEDLVEVTATGGRVLSLGLAPPELPVLGQILDHG